MSGNCPGAGQVPNKLGHLDFEKSQHFQRFGGQVPTCACQTVAQGEEAISPTGCRSSRNDVPRGTIACSANHDNAACICA